MRAIDVHHAFAAWLPRLWSEPRDALQSWPVDGLPTTPHYRLALALAAEPTWAPGAADLVALIRSVARWHILQSGNPNWTLTLPRELIVRGRDLWPSASLQVFSDSRSSFLRAYPWRPAWSDSPDLPPDDNLYDLESRRSDMLAAGDPMLRRLALTSYRSIGQQAAVRTIMTASPGSTIVVNLPTGSGKTVCALLPALSHGLDEGKLLGVTPIIVPTVALAADLDRRLRPILGHSACYTPSNQSEARDIRARITAGQQGPVLTSPESLVGSLRGCLRQAAQKQMIRAFVVDEAHMVTAWGDEFRPAFQQIPGVRRELASLAGIEPFVTVLMSATFSELALSTINDLFPVLAAKGEHRAVHAVRLRPEPTWWSAKISTEEERESGVLDALMHLPRPLIIYALKRSDVHCFLDLCTTRGYRRVGVISGETEDVERDHLLAAWNADKIDVMIATSAFGLGVDKPDVRAVIHAALPEGLDRLYQDVGRGGRDGRSSASILFWHGRDWRPAAAIASPTLISAERGKQRWRAMFFGSSKRALGNDRYILDLSEPPSAASGDIDMDSEQNQKWNCRTLTLMARAKLLETDAGVVGEDDRVTGESLTVQLLRGGLDGDDVWAVVEAKRQELQKSYRRNLDLLSKALAGKECIANVLQECYESSRYGVEVVRACGGCRFCRSQGRSTVAGRLRVIHLPRSPTPPRQVSELLTRLCRGRRLCPLYYRGSTLGADWERRMTRAAWHLALNGIVNFMAPGSLVNKWRSDTSLLIPSHPVFLHEQWPGDVTRLQPTACIIGNEDAPNWEEMWSMSRGCDTTHRIEGEIPSPTVILLPSDQRDPTRSDRPARLILSGDSLEEWEEELDE